MTRQNERPADMARYLNDLERRIKALEEPEPDTGWLPMTPLFFAWVVYEVGGATWAEPAYRRIGKRVYLRGLIKNGGTSNAIFTLPVGFRPTKTFLFAVPSSICMLRIDVTEAGIVTSNGLVTGTADTSWTSLFPISFPLG